MKKLLFLNGSLLKACRDCATILVLLLGFLPALVFGQSFHKSGNLTLTATYSTSVSYYTYIAGYGQKTPINITFFNLGTDTVYIGFNTVTDLKDTSSATVINIPPKWYYEEEMTPTKIAYLKGRTSGIPVRFECTIAAGPSAKLPMNGSQYALDSMSNLVWNILVDSTNQELGLNGELVRWWNNPILVASAGQDSLGLLDPSVNRINDTTFVMIYVGYSNYYTPRLMRATSKDGLVWNKYSTNAVFTESGSGLKNRYNWEGRTLWERDTLKMWYQAADTTNYIFQTFYAYSTDTGKTFTRNSNNAVFGVDAGNAGWSANYSGFRSVLKKNGKYYAFYEGRETSDSSFKIGGAVSNDGITWTNLSSSAPLITNRDTWNTNKGLMPTVALIDNRFVMFYSVNDLDSNYSGRTGTAFSFDGIRWYKGKENDIVNIHNKNSWEIGNLMGVQDIIKSSSVGESYILYYRAGGYSGSASKLGAFVMNSGVTNKTLQGKELVFNGQNWTHLQDSISSLRGSIPGSVDTSKFVHRPDSTQANHYSTVGNVLKEIYNNNSNFYTKTQSDARYLNHNDTLLLIYWTDTTLTVSTKKNVINQINSSLGSYYTKGQSDVRYLFNNDSLLLPFLAANNTYSGYNTFNLKVTIDTVISNNGVYFANSNGSGIRVDNDSALISFRKSGLRMYTIHADSISSATDRFSLETGKANNNIYIINSSGNAYIGLQGTSLVLSNNSGGDIQFGNNIKAGANNAYDLGTSISNWKNLYLAGNMIWTRGTPPASAGATGTANTFLIGTDGYLYYCSATNTWLRLGQFLTF
ncbi:hypothetical protein BH10BAC5_BH10BAC5_16870 [soil metagenome]